MAIYDTMQYIKCDVSTICIGMAASMGAFLLAGGAKGKRFALPNAEIMIHQPLWRSTGTGNGDRDCSRTHSEAPKKKLNEYSGSNAPVSRWNVIVQQTLSRDNYMSC